MRLKVFGAFLVGAVLLASPVAAGRIVEGVIVTVDSSSVQIGSETYLITDETVWEDQAGRHVDPSELHSGARVEADIGDSGKLELLKADLLR